MFVSQLAMLGIPNVTLLSALTAAFTLNYRERALVPLYVYIILYGMFYGFTMWWLPYLYIWLPLWLSFMVAGKIKIPQKAQVPLYMALCGLHGLSFGAMYSPVPLLISGFDFKELAAWILAGLPFDIAHALGNIASGVLVIPLCKLLKTLDNHTSLYKY